MINSYRTFDTRLEPSSSKLVAGHVYQVPLSFNTNDPAPVVPPTGTVGVFYNVTLTETEGAGFLEIDALPFTDQLTSTVNWSAAGQTVANSGTTRVKIGDDGSLVFGMRVGGSAIARAHVIVDITAFIVDA